MNMRKLLLVLGIGMSSVVLKASGNLPLLSKATYDLNADSTGFQLISSYDHDTEEVLVKINLTEESIVGIELYDMNDKIIKLWQPEIAATGTYLSKLLMYDMADGRYRLKVLINEETFEQAVFKF